MLRRLIPLLAAVAIMLGIGGAAWWLQTRPPEIILTHSALSGGAGTVHTISADAFAKPAANMHLKNAPDFSFGNKLFNTNWVEAPASVKTLDGLGPLFNRVSCSGCHFKDGRGRAPKDDSEPFTSMLLRISIPGKNEVGGPLPHPVYGDQIEDHAIQHVPVEGTPRVHYAEMPSHYEDGTPYSLRAPEYRIENLGYGPLGDIQISPRVASAMIGLGLLEAIPDAQLEQWASEGGPDGIRGHVNHVWSILNNGPAIGRFGWKANAPSIREQVANAAHGDIGLSSALHPKQNCTSAQTACLAAPAGGTPEAPEVSAMQMDKFTFYSRTLAVPARRDVEANERGEALFSQLGCAACHKPTVTTGDHEVAALAHQIIHPYTDLLLHDMGEALADHRPDFEATGSQWRTAPLWGIGLVETVNGHTSFLHDGRARNLEEAILWHGGEAEAAKTRFTKLPKDDRAALLKFLNSL